MSQDLDPSPNGRDSFASLMAAAKNGSAEALGRLLEGSRQYLLLVANQRLDPDLRAKLGGSDVVQETFLEAQRDFGGFDGQSEDELLAWLARLLLNNLRDATERFRGTEKRDITREVPMAEGPAPAADRRLTTTETPSWQARLRERQDVLRRALERLPDDQREVIVLRNFEVLSFADIGRRMNRSPEAVRKLWGRAVQALEQQLPDWDTLC